MKFYKKPGSGMAWHVIGVLTAMILIFGLIVSFIGYRCIVSAFEKEYTSVTYHMADSATLYVNGDHIDEYLAGSETEEYKSTKQQLDNCCQKLNVSLIYVIKVDESDYNSFVSVFNSVNNSVDNTDYTEWEMGYERDTTNLEYKQIYQKLYAQSIEYGTLFRMNPPEGQHKHITTLVPVKDSKGKVSAILCVQRPISEMENAVKPYFIYILVGALVMMIVLSGLAATFLKRSIIDPLETVSKEATRFADEKSKGEPLGAVSRYDVICNLTNSIDSMESDMVKYIDDVTRFTAEEERISAELSIAANIQKDSLPDVFPAFPDRSEFDIYAIMDPAMDVGGDFYNFFLIDDDHLALVIADVSGKGIPGCLTMMATNILINSKAEQGVSPAEVFKFVNRSLYEHNSAEMFITAWMGILEISTGKLVASNAGHEYPTICRKDGCFEILKDKHALVLGGIGDVNYKDYEIQLNKGDKLFVYTDGLPEATDSDMKMFGMERTLEALNKYRDKSPQGILEGVKDSVDTFVGDARQFDDLTMLCIEIK